MMARGISLCTGWQRRSLTLNSLYVLDITLGGGVADVPDMESLDGLILEVLGQPRR